MQLFKYTDTTMADAEAIEGWDSASWTEKYQEPGEFKIEAKLKSGLFDLLDIGDFISHKETYEVCMVESIEITEDEDSDPKVEITGRTLDAFLEYRITGYRTWVSFQTPPVANYVVSAAPVANQLVTMINAENAGLDQFPGTVATTSIPAEGASIARTLKRDYLNKAVLEMLGIYDYGLRIIRANSFGEVGQTGLTEMNIHKGVNRAGSVIFSAKTGDVVNAKYLKSSKSSKTAVFATGKWVYRQRGTGLFNWDRRYAILPASDVDDKYNVAPTGSDLTNIQQVLADRGDQFLEANKAFLDISNVEISKNSRYRYRRDYNIGDIVTVDGKYGVIQARRVVANTEIVDQEGATSFPTLEVIPTNALL